MLNKYANFFKVLFTFIILLLASLIAFSAYVYHDLKDKDYSMLYVLGEGNYIYEEQKYPKFVYNAYLEFARNNKESYLKLEPSPIIWVITSNQNTKDKIKMIEKMLATGISINTISTDAYKDSAIFTTITFADLEMFDYLISKGIDLNLRDAAKRTVLEFGKFALKKKQEISPTSFEIAIIEKMIVRLEKLSIQKEGIK